MSHCLHLAKRLANSLSISSSDKSSMCWKWYPERQSATIWKYCVLIPNTWLNTSKSKHDIVVIIPLPIRSFESYGINIWIAFLYVVGICEVGNYYSCTFEI